MELIVMRHGEASWDAPSDRERVLTARGELCARNAGRYLVSQGWLPDVLLTSPYTRALQTAAGVAQAFPGLEAQLCDELAPDNSPEAVVAVLNALEQDRVMVFSHQPLVGRLLGWMLHDDMSQQPPMDTASMCCVRADGFIGGSVELIWHLHPAIYSESL